MNTKNKIICDYADSTNSSEDTLEFLIQNCRDICKEHSFNTFKEMTLNYRICFDQRNKSKIIKDYEKYILTKTKFHKSNLAISYNMIDQIGVSEELEKKIINFMYSQIQDSYLDKFRQLDNAKLKKYMIMNYVDKHILTRGKQ